MECWQELIFSRAEIWWSAGSKKGETCKWTTIWFVHRAHGQIYCWWQWYGLGHRRRIRHVVIVQIILAQGEWSSAKDSRPILERCNTRQQQTFFTLGMFMSSTLEASVFMGKNYPEILHSIKNTGKTSHNETDVRHIWQVDNRTSRRDLWSEYFMETFIFDWWWRSHQSLARAGLRILIFWVMPWIDEREPTIENCLGRQVDVVQKFNTELWTQMMVSQWNSSGIFPGIHHIAALQQIPRVPVKHERRARRIYRTDHLHVDVQRHLMGV